MSSLTFNDGRTIHQFASSYEMVEYACRHNSPFLSGDSVLVEHTKWFAVQNKDKALIQKLEDSGHDMSSYIEQHASREAKLAEQLAKL